jgi:hypothetical protein
LAAFQFDQNLAVLVDTVLQDLARLDRAGVSDESGGTFHTYQPRNYRIDRSVIVIAAT